MPGTLRYSTSGNLQMPILIMHWYPIGQVYKVTDVLKINHCRFLMTLEQCYSIYITLYANIHTLVMYLNILSLVKPS
jgi:hypothetical protein